MNKKALKVYDDIKELENVLYKLQDTRYKNITCYTSTFLHQLIKQVERELDGYKAIRDMCEK